MRTQDAIEQRLNQSPNDIFLIDTATPRDISYARLDAMTRSIAKALLAQGCPSSRAIILAENGPHFAAAYLALMRIGWCAVPANLLLHETDIRFILDHAGTQIVLASTKAFEHFAPQMNNRVLLPLDELAASDPPSSWQRPDLAPPRTPACLMFTSGTTGQPKGVIHSGEALLAAADVFNMQLGFGAHTRMLHNFSMGYMAGLLNSLLCPFQAGGSVVIGPPPGPQLALRFWNIVREHLVNTLWVPPQLLAIAKQADRSDKTPVYCRQNIQRICVGTAPLPDRLRDDFWRQYHTELLESYGLTELLFLTAHNPDTERRPGSAGPLLEGVRARSVDADGLPLPPGSVGELQISASWRMIGYLDMQTSQPMPETSPEWFATGDIGYVDSDGFLYVTGRKKDLIIRGGLNISPRRIEQAIEELPPIREAAVIGVDDRLKGEQIWAALVSDEPPSPVREQVDRYLRDRLPKPMLPDRVFFVTDLPRNTNGKINKNRLRGLLLTRTGSNQ
jgi:long-chain acyl-CoA synthetase